MMACGERACGALRRREYRGHLAAKGLCMGVRNSGDGGFTLVELMVVVLIIGILVTIATPVYVVASRNAAAKSCQANQRTITGAVDLVMTDGDDYSAASAGQFVAAGSGWYAILIPGWIKNAPTCPSDGANYYVTLQGTVTGDNGPVQTFKQGHAAQ
jgi:prepilin-type N-terminal cleavage/methylation domain-containing protein